MIVLQSVQDNLTAKKEPEIFLVARERICIYVSTAAVRDGIECMASKHLLFNAILTHGQGLNSNASCTCANCQGIIIAQFDICTTIEMAGRHKKC